MAKHKKWRHKRYNPNGYNLKSPSAYNRQYHENMSSAIDAKKNGSHEKSVIHNRKSTYNWLALNLQESKGRPLSKKEKNVLRSATIYWDNNKDFSDAKRKRKSIDKLRRKYGSEYLII